MNLNQKMKLEQLKELLDQKYKDCDVISKPDYGEEVICHLFKVRYGCEIFMVTVCGSRYKAELYLKNETNADDIEWIKSYILTEDIVIKKGKHNKTIGREGFFLRMEFLCFFGTLRHKPKQRGDC